MKRSDWIENNITSPGAQPGLVAISGLQLIHFSKEKSVLAGKTYEQTSDNKGYMKPAGLWVSDESDFGWSKWCRGEDFNVDALENAHLVSLKSDANILMLKTIEEIDAFTEKYSVSMFPDMPAGMNITTIDWKRVAIEYQGLVITPYQWERRFHPGCNWYYGWDCASGIIWDTSCIERIKLLPGYQLPKLEN